MGEKDEREEQSDLWICRKKVSLVFNRHQESKRNLKYT